MRSNLVLRLALVLGLIIAIGVPGLQALEPLTADAQISDEGMPPGDVWTGEVDETGARSAATASASASTEPLIVRFRSRTSRGSQLQTHRDAGARRADALSLTDTVRVEVPAGQRDAALGVYNAQAAVLYAEPDYEVHALYTPNDPEFTDQWGPKKVGAQAAWDISRGSADVKVAVVDCGVFSQATGRLAGDGQAGHPDLRGRVTQNKDFTGASTGFDDHCNHGTHVAGIIGAAGNNGIGISGLAPRVSVMNVKVLDDTGSGSSSTIVNGVIWAVDNGAKVVNMSLGRDGACLQSERDAMSYAWQRGVVVVAAAGNSGAGASGAPANCDNVISVASTTSSDGKSSFSNYGTNVDVAAPGSSILSTVRTGEYSSFSGTSMASPHVAALAGLIWSAKSGASAQYVVDRIKTTSDKISGTGTSWAWGRINAAAALNGLGSPVSTNTPTPTATSTATATKTPTNTPTQTPVPTRVTCPSPRPPVQVVTSATSAANTEVTLKAGAGLIREISFSDLKNAAVTIGDKNGATSPFVYKPATYVGQLSFSVTRPNVTQAWTVSLAITDDCGAWTTFVGGGANTGPRGTLTGTVRNASNSQPISGATVSVHGAQLSDTTDGNGAFKIGNVPTGNVTLDVSASGFTSQSAQTTVEERRTSTVNVNLTPAGQAQAISIALTWGSSPADMDLHMSGPTTGSSRFHIYWNNQGAAPNATISDDDDNGGGPETATIQKSTATGNWVPGEYRIWAHNYTGTPGFSGSSAKVTVKRGDQVLGTYNVSSASGTATQSLWRAVNVTVDANGNATLSPVQQFTSGGSSTVLSIPDGSDGAITWPATGKK